MLSETRVGAQQNQDGAAVVARAGKTGEMCVTDAHGRHAEAVMRGNVFCAANQGATTFTALATTGATGFGLVNPAGSGRILVLLEVILTTTAVIGGVGEYWLGTNISTTGAAITFTSNLIVRNCLLGSTGPAGAGLASASYTQLGTNAIFRQLLGWSWVTAQTSVEKAFVKDEVAGAVVLSPGAMIGVYGLGTFPTAAVSMTWEEVPV